MTHVAVHPGDLFILAVSWNEPAAIGVTKPASFTTATAGLLELQTKSVGASLASQLRFHLPW